MAVDEDSFDADESQSNDNTEEESDDEISPNLYYDKEITTNKFYDNYMLMQK